MRARSQAWSASGARVPGADTHSRRVTPGAGSACDALETVFRCSPSAIMITDGDNRIVAVNAAFERLTGYLEDEVLGRNPSILKSGMHDTAFYAAMWTTLQRDGRWVGEVWDRRKDGSHYPKWLEINVVCDAETGGVTHYVASFNDLSPSKIAEERIRQLAYHDPLTGLPNRLLLRERLERGLIRAARHRGGLALLFIDLDRFKNVNDSLGHAVGDALLEEVARRLVRSVRGSDTVARIGGDEFVVLLEDVEREDDVVAVVDKILAAFDFPVGLGREDLHVFSSIGIALYPRDGEDVETLMRNADTAMYQAKAAGSNQFRFFAPFMNAHARERLDIENTLHSALQRDEFEMHYQPIIDLASGGVASAEALVRWRRPDGLVPPGRFIPVAEENGLIVRIGEWVFERVCEDLTAWDRAGIVVPRISINLSPRQFALPGLADRIGEILARNEVAAERIELELTEGAFMEHPERAVRTLHALKQMGVSLAIDDFGSGYSSLTYLKRFPIDRLKIDQSFVRDILEDERDREITSAVIALSHNLGLQVVAEGIEHVEQLELMRDHRCDYVQGYYLSRPMDAEAFARYMDTA